MRCIGTGVCGCCVPRLGVGAVSCGALWDKLGRNAALTRSTEAGLVPAGGSEPLLVEALLRTRLLMGARLERPLAGSRHV